MGKNNIEKWSFGYEMLRKFTGIWHNLFYYKHIYVLHEENIPKDEQYIITPVHQNALMDAMAILLKMKKQPVFLARSDIFRKNLIARFLYFIKILPIYRIRDGYATLKKNEEIFGKTMDVLTNKNGLVILPEGRHAHLRKLKNLKKGVARLAFQAAEKQNFSKDIKIIPAGLDYSDYSKIQQDLIINYGEPISLAKYYDLYKSHPNKAIVEVVRELSDAMKKQMIHIGDDENYEIYNDLRQLFEKYITVNMDLNPRDPAQRLEAQQKFIKLLEEYLHTDKEKAREVEEKLHDYNRILQRYKLRNWLIDKRLMSFPGFLWRMIIFLLFSPLFIYGFINNILPYKISFDLANKIKDKTFHSSFNFVISLLLFPLFHLIQTGIFYLFVRQPWYTLVYFISLPLTGLFAFRYYILFKKFRARWRYTKLNHRKTPEIKKLQDLHRFFISLTARIISGKKN